MLRATVERATLLSTLRLIEPLIGERPERTRVLVEVEADVVRVSSSDGEQLITATCPASACDRGRVIVPGRLLLDFIRASDATAVRLALSTAQAELDLTAEESSIALACFPPTTWRSLTPCEGDEVTWSATDLDQLARITHAASRDVSRGALRGVCFGNGWAAATDAYRLAAVCVPFTSDEPAVVPNEAINALVRIYDGGPCSVRFADGKVTFELRRATITSTLIAEEFPDWPAGVPDGGPESVTFGKVPMLSALDRLAILASKEHLGTLTVSVENNRLRLECRVPDVGRQVDHVQGDCTMTAVSFQLRFLRAAVEQTRTDPVVLRMASALKPAVVREQDFIAMILPIRT